MSVKDTSVKDNVLAYLEEHRGSFASGASLAQALDVSRNAVWKAVKALEGEGYPIQGVTNKGYRLAQECNKLSAASIQKYVEDPRIQVEYLEVVDSTNEYAKKLAAQGFPEGTLVVANSQTAGKGRQGRPFYSPPDTGVYFTLLTRPKFSLADVSLMTSYAAVCTAIAMEEIVGAQVQIKWVNDIFVNGHKCCGILTEAAVLPESGGIDYAVVGIGINVAEPEGGFPHEFSGVAQALTPRGSQQGDARARLVARIVGLFMADYANIPARPHLEQYRRRDILSGRSVNVVAGNEEYRAKVLGINDDFSLQVQLEDGSQRALEYGEVHIASSQLT